MCGVFRLFFEWLMARACHTLVAVSKSPGHDSIYVENVLQVFSITVAHTQVHGTENPACVLVTQLFTHDSNRELETITYNLFFFFFFNFLTMN
jgi:hypothetical protein